MNNDERKQKVKDIYVDNELFTSEYIKWKKQLIEARANNLPDPKITEYLGECILKICTRLTYMPSFYNYTYKDQFISDALENCIKCFANFDENAISKRTGKKTSGPFSYFTTIAYWAFVRTIKFEKNQFRIKQKYISRLSNVVSEISEYGSEDYDNEYINYLKNLLDEDFQEYDDKKMGKHKKDVDNTESDDIIDEIGIDIDLLKEVMENDTDEFI